MALRLLALIALMALALAYLLQYGFGLAPCEMCLIQRVPYAVVVAVGGVGSLFAVRHLPRKMVLLVVLLAFGVELGMAGYHVAIERGYVKESGCVAAAGNVDSIEAMRAAILEAPLVSCDQPTAVFFHASLAEWNLLFALVLVVLSGLIARKYWASAEVGRRTYW